MNGNIDLSMLRRETQKPVISYMMRIRDTNKYDSLMCINNYSGYHVYSIEDLRRCRQN